ncbi:MAG: Bd3614 family nucleic acid deaminase [Xanthomonadaceae bacterium]|nr:Bd3614 family nucleic acid deaminase [Xanthomonadaceae bacterium]
MFEERWYWSQYQRSSRFEPVSAVTQLVQGIWEKYPSRAREILRERIYTTEIVPVLDPEMVKVSAKRMSLVTMAEWKKLKLLQNEEIVFDPQSSASFDDQNVSFTETQAMNFLLRELKDRSEQSSLPLYSRDRAVGAMLLSVDGQVLNYALNQNALNRTLHAETICFQGYWFQHREAVPAGSTLITTLSPCRQCAAMIETSGESIKAVYLEKDLGRFGSCAGRNVVFRDL